MSKERTAEESNGIFFYADEDAALYDELAPLTDPTYDLLHNSLVNQFSAWIRYMDSENLLADGLQVFDIGCGTGAEALRLLNENDKVQVLGVDISAKMLEQFGQKLPSTFQNTSASSRCILVKADIRDPHWYKLALAERDSRGWADNLTAIVTVYTLHHFSSTMKRGLYKDIHNYLPQGGVFVNADLFSFETPWLAKMAQLSVESWIAGQFEQASNNCSKYSIQAPSDWKILTEHWLTHVREQNKPLPAMAGRKAGVAKGYIDCDRDLLIEAGFDVVECTFRYGQSAILWAFK